MLEHKTLMDKILRLLETVDIVMKTVDKNKYSNLMEI